MKTRAIAITAIAATAVIGLGACSSSSTTSNSPAPTGDLNTMNANGVTYKYPRIGRNERTSARKRSGETVLGSKRWVRTQSACQS